VAAPTIVNSRCENAQAFLAKLPNRTIEKPFKGARLREVVRGFLR
jgi:hypothetical protein